MKQLLILRHAQAAGTDIGGSDKTRKLTPKGNDDASALGKLMVKEGLNPDLVLCSAATRTRETLDGVLSAFDNDVSVDYANRLYNSDYQYLMMVAQEASDDIETLMIVAHNPGTHEFAARLAEEDGSDRVDRLSMNYAPATLTVFDCDIERWKDLRPYANKVKAVHESVEYNADDRPTRWM